MNPSLRPTILGVCVLGLLAASASSQGEPRVVPELAGFEPFLGKTWKGLVDADKGIYDVSRWEPALAGRAIRMVHSVADGAYGGETLVMVDPESGDIVYTYFTTAGFFTNGTLWFDDGGALHSREVVRGNKAGVSEVRARMELTPGGSMTVTTRMLRDGTWEDRPAVVYSPDPAARLVLARTVPPPEAPDAGAGAPAGGSGGEAESSSFSHADWAATLERFVDRRGLVDYQGLARDREVFDRYVRDIEARSPRSHPQLFAGRDEELAYWINAYNALIFDGVLDRGPETESVWTGGLISGRAFFVGRQITVGGETTNLKSLEDDWIRAGYEDPRIHAALNCASISCPRLPREPFTGDRLDAQLDAAMREFVADPRNVMLRDDGSVGLSKIFDWFARDFLDEERRRGVESPSILGYVNRYRAADARLPAGAKVDYFPYDKGINGQ